MSQQSQFQAGADPASPSLPGDGLSDVLKDFDRWALFLDIDGTLIDLAETPDGIIVPEDLPADLDRLSKKLGGALALVTGRALPYADRLFAPYRFPIAGLHGAEQRMADGTIERVVTTPEFELLKARLMVDAAGWEGVLIEDKGAAVGAHYRRAPERQADLERLMQQAADEAGEEFKLQRGKMVIELRPARASKGEALRSFLRDTAFSGRLPIAIGDDLTDEAMFAAANALGGLSVRIGEATLPDGNATEARMLVSSAADLRTILADYAH